MNTSEGYCYCCTESPKDKRNLKDFNEEDKELYKEFTGIDLRVENRICVGCRESLRNSVEFLNLCKSSHSKFTLIDDQNETRISEIPLEDILIESCAPEEEQNQDGEIYFDQDDEIPISELRQKTEDSDMFNYEVIEIRALEKPKAKKLKSNERRYICDYPECNLRFNQANALRCHKRIHTNERPYVCSYCNKSFTQNTTLKTHVVAKHTGKELDCPLDGCTRKFSRNSFLKQHIRKDHELLRDYSCQECEKSYKQKSHLDRHVEASHKNIRHQCSSCEKSFSKAWSLKMHSFVHTNVENYPYKCSECGMNFPRRDKLLKHFSKEHPSIKIELEPIEIIKPVDVK